MLSFRPPSLALAFALIWAIATPPAEAQDLSSVQAVCTDCHVEAGTDKSRALSHADSVTCLSCHHIGFSNDPEMSAARRVDACRSCHLDLAVPHERQALSGIRGREAAAIDAPDCVACHSIHDDPPLDVSTAQVSDRCATCHVERHPLHSEVAADAPTCASCHVEHAKGLATGRVSAAGSCDGCHTSVHPSHTLEGDGSFDCTRCHGIDTDPALVRDVDRVSESCSACHTVYPTHVTAGADAPTCAECHAFVSDPVMSEAGPAISLRCGACHEEEMAEYRSGGHADALAETNANADLPSCVSCHASHADPGQGRALLRLAATAECVACHSSARLIEKYGLPQEAAASYLDDYHGVTVTFLRLETANDDQADVLICADCHGPHQADWPEGRSVAEVCVRCHEDGDVKLAGAWLGHAPIGPQSQIGVWAVRIFYYGMIPFVLGGLLLNIIFSLVAHRRSGARMLRSEGIRKIKARLSGSEIESEPTVTRFSLTERLEHFGAMITFSLLVVTGLPQVGPATWLGQSIIAVFGGISSTRLLHRGTGFAFVALLLVHLVRGINAVIRSRSLPHISPRKQDFVDGVDMVRHLLWNTPRPKAGKFDASEKFEYWGLFFGGIIMCVTGVALVFPELVTQVLPGAILAALRTVHGLEATFAVLVVVLWHSYGVIFRPEIFPLDTSMFSGKISVERLREEHALHHEELFPED